MNRIDSNEVISFFRNNPEWKLFTYDFIDYSNMQACVLGAIMISRSLDSKFNRIDYAEGSFANSGEAQFAAAELCNSMGYALGLEAGSNSQFGPEDSFLALMWVGNCALNNLPKDRTVLTMSQRAKDMFGSTTKLVEFDEGYKDGYRIWEQLKEAGIVTAETK